MTVQGLTPRQIAWRLFVTCWAVYALHFATNIVREIYPAMTLGDHATFNVYEYLGLHPDIFQPDPAQDRAFINNNPGASMVGALPYTLTRPGIDRITAAVNRRRASSGGGDAPAYETNWPMAKDFFRQVYQRGLDIKFGLAAAVMQALAMAPLSALSAVVMFFVLLRLTGTKRAALWLALLYAFATPLFFRTGQLNQNVLACHAGFFGFALLFRVDQENPKTRLGLYTLSGLLLGWAVVCDYSGLVTLVVVSLYGLWQWLHSPGESRSVMDLVAFSGGVLASASILMAYQWTSFGSPFFPAQHYMPFATFTHMGYAGMDRPHLDLLWQTAFGLRFGLFTSAPILLLALWPPAWSRRVRIVGPPEIWCIAALVLGFLLFCSANQYGRMQFNTGVRHIVPVVPFLFLVVAGVLIKLPAKISILAGVVGTYWSWCLAMYRDVELGLGVLESVKHITLNGPRFPWLTTLELMPQFPGFVSNRFLAPVLLAALAAGLWLLWRQPRPTADG